MVDEQAIGRIEGVTRVTTVVKLAFWNLFLRTYCSVDAGGNSSLASGAVTVTCA